MTQDVQWTIVFVDKIRNFCKHARKRISISPAHKNCQLNTKIQRETVNVNIEYDLYT